MNLLDELLRFWFWRER